MKKIIDKNNVIWSCRRGMLELDLYIMPFFTQVYESLSDDEKYIFVDLMSEFDLNLWKWFFKGEDSPEKYVKLIAKIKEFHHNNKNYHNF